jgi:hypothetical protein
LRKRFAEKHLMGCSAKNGSELKIAARGRYELKRFFDELNE